MSIKPDVPGCTLNRLPFPLLDGRAAPFDGTAGVPQHVKLGALDVDLHEPDPRPGRDVVVDTDGLDGRVSLATAGPDEAVDVRDDVTRVEEAGVPRPGR